MARALRPEEYTQSWVTIQRLLDESGKYKKDLCQYLGISANVATKWRNGTSASFIQYIDKIAEYLSVSTDYLLGIGKEKYLTNSLSNTEAIIIQKYRTIDYGKQKILMDLLDTWISN